MFRDSRGVVHTVSSADPLTDVPAGAATALARALLAPTEGDLGSALERCEAVSALLERWQDAFFAALPAEFDLEEEKRYAALAGVSLDELDELEDDWDEDELTDAAEEEDVDEPELEVMDLDEVHTLLGHAADPATARLDEVLVGELERELLLLPMRVRLEALMGAGALVEGWADLLADHEKLLGHLVLAHAQEPRTEGHEQLADLHARLHAGVPGHG